MENQKNDNLNLLEAVVQNTEMGKNTLEQIVPMTEDPAFRAELLRERNLYRELNQEAHTAIEACGGHMIATTALTANGLIRQALLPKNGFEPVWPGTFGEKLKRDPDPPPAS